MRLYRTFTCYLVLTAVALATMPIVAYADTCRDAITAIYASRDSAYAKLDVDGVLAGHTIDFVRYDVRGQAFAGTDRDRRLLTYSFAHCTSVNSVTTVTSCAQKDDTATVTISHRYEIVMPSSAGPHDLVSITTARSFWIRTSQGWLEKISRQLTESHTMNGTPV